MVILLADEMRPRRVDLGALQVWITWW